MQTITTTTNVNAAQDNLEAACHKTAAAQDTFSGESFLVDLENLGAETNLPYFDQLEKLEVRRQNWESNELAASHARLYNILTACYGYYLRMKSSEVSKEVRQGMSSGLNVFIESRGFRTLANTHDMNRVVKAVFGEDRRRVSAYALVLRIALEANWGKTAVKASELSGWIARQGGVEEIRVGQSKAKGLPVADRVAIAKASVLDKPLMNFKPDTRTMAFGAEDIDKPRVLIVTYRPNGELEISSVVRNDSVVKAALAAHYEANKAALGTALPNANATKPSAVAVALSAAAG
jgi:hypothetical protein